MPFKSIDECKPEEALRYIQCYFATVDLISSALAKYETLASTATTVMERSRFRALVLQAKRDLELLANQRRAFLTEGAGIAPPDEGTVAATRERAVRLAAIAAQEALAGAIIGIATQGLEAFRTLNGETARSQSAAVPV